MASKYLHISFIFRDRLIIDELEDIFEQAKDWIRYSENCWIVYTSVNPQKWFDRIREIVSEKDSVLILEINPVGRKGRMSKVVWNWFRKERVS